MSDAPAWDKVGPTNDQLYSPPSPVYFPNKQSSPFSHRLKCYTLSERFTFKSDSPKRRYILFLAPCSGAFSILFSLEPLIFPSQGRVLYDLFLYPLVNHSDKDSGYFIEYDPRPSTAPPLLDIINRYILRSKVKVNDLGSDWSVWAAWGDQPSSSDPERCWHWAPSQAIESNWKTTHSPWETADPLRIFDRRVDGMGQRELVPRGLKRALWTCLNPKTTDS